MIELRIIFGNFRLLRELEVLGNIVNSKFLPPFLTLCEHYDSLLNIEFPGTQESKL